MTDSMMFDIYSVMRDMADPTMTLTRWCVIPANLCVTLNQLSMTLDQLYSMCGFRLLIVIVIVIFILQQHENIYKHN